jgi:hypothetical protein
VSGQLESRHYFRARDIVQHRDGWTGRVVEGQALYAVVEWADGRTEEVEQFDPRIVVLDRAEAP